MSGGGHVVVRLADGTGFRCVKGDRVTFSPHALFRFDGAAEERLLLAVLGRALLKRGPMPVLGRGPLWFALIEVCPKLARWPVLEGGGATDWPGEGPVFVPAVDALTRFKARSRAPDGVTVWDATLLAEVCPEDLPARAWVPIDPNIYPFDLPDLEFDDGLDFLLLDCPARNLALMPNGLGYVHNALKHAGIRYQTFDLDIVTYHRFHIARLYDHGGRVRLTSGRDLPEDPWKAEHYDLWRAEDVLAHFEPELNEALGAIVAARPKVIGFSVHQCNEAFSRELARRVRAALPETEIVVGGFSCYNADIGKRVFPECDYMVIGEAELVIASLAASLAKGGRPANLPGVLSRHDDPDRVFTPGPMPHDLDRIDFPKYEWFDFSVYRNFNGYQLTPIIASRGCRWSRCTFCAERFFWRVRSAKAFVDELEWLVSQGCSLFMFNESDLNGMPEKLLDICDEIIRRGLSVKLTGQLRIHKKSDRAFFDKLRAAGFVSLRFGVDAFSANTMRLQKKGYTPEIVSRNLRDCWEAGIFTEVNWVVGVPGETWADVEEGVEFILSNQRHIGTIANINPLILVNGSVYWLDPEAHGIRFHQPTEILFRDNWRAIPADQWYSVDPHIDHETRRAYFEHIVLKLHDAAFPVGDWARRVIDDVKLSRDKARAGRRGAPNPSEGSVDGGAPAAAGDDPSALLASRFDRESILVAHGETYLVLDGKDMPRRAEGGFKARRGRAATRLVAPRVGVLSRLREAFSQGRRGPRGDAYPTPVSPVQAVVSEGATPELIRVIGTYNIVGFDGAFYGVPHGLPIEWSIGDACVLPEVFRAPSLVEIVRLIQGVSGAPEPVGDRVSDDATRSRETHDPGEPTRVGTLDDYAIISYEGWFYGVPNQGRDMDLRLVDALDVPGVIRDVSRDVVEGEILEARSWNVAE